MSKEARAELVARIRLARRQRRNNDEVMFKNSTASYTGDQKQAFKNESKDFSRNNKKHKRQESYAFARRE